MPAESSLPSALAALAVPVAEPKAPGNASCSVQADETSGCWNHHTAWWHCAVSPQQEIIDPATYSEFLKGLNFCTDGICMWNDTHWEIIMR